MKYFFANLGVNLCALACIGFAGYLLIHDKEGWGWFLFVAALCSGSASISEHKSKG
jgi:hypothetical protein